MATQSDISEWFVFEKESVADRTAVWWWEECEECDPGHFRSSVVGLLCLFLTCHMKILTSAYGEGELRRQKCM
jgi:hypothetical protein